MALPWRHTSCRDRRRDGRWRAAGSYVQQQVLALPWRDFLQELVVFGCFHDLVDEGEFRPQQVAQRRGGGEMLQRVEQAARNLALAAIGVAGKDRPVRG